MSGVLPTDGPPAPPRSLPAVLLLAAVATVLAVLTACAPAPSGVRPDRASEVVRDDLQSVFAARGLRGTLAVLDTATGRRTLVDADRARQPTPPESTFKIAHSIVALETGVVTEPERQVLPHGGGPQPFASWERDMTLREAVTESNAAIFMGLARRIGPVGEQQWLDRLDYGNRQVGDRPDRFWLGGPLAISPVAQTDWLARLAARELPVSRRSQDTVADVIRLDTTPTHTLYGKTGWRFAPPPGRPQLGWWVGWVERPGRAPVTFALTLDMRGAPDAPARTALGRELLGRLGVLPAP